MESVGDQPPEGAVEKAVGQARESGDLGRVLKVLYLDEKGETVGEWRSRQLPEAQWSGQNVAGLQQPPLSLEQLVYLAESHPVHSAALEQKAADICGKGWEWVESGDAEDVTDDSKKEVEDWFQGLAPDDEDMQEIIHSAWLDVETVGWGLFELARDPQGIVKRVYHVPGHTVRAHRDGFRLCQMRENRKVWFRRWGATDIAGRRVDVDATSGSLRVIHDQANDMFVIKRKSRRSTWYGIPGYVSAIGWITLALAARDDNLYFFSNRREPRWAIVITGIQDNPDLENDLRRAFTVDLRQPYRNVLIPITGPTGKVEFQKMTDNRMEGSFDKLSDRADKAIVIAHRVPADRIANSAVGPLGGNSADAVNRIYKEGVVAPGQELLNVRLNRFISVEYGKALAGDSTEPPIIPFTLQLDDLDIETDREELDLTIAAWKSDLIIMREARRRVKLDPLMQRATIVDPVSGQATPDPEAEEVESPYNDMLYTELPGVGKGGGEESPSLMASRGDPALALIDADVRELLRESREVNERLAEMARDGGDE